MKQDEFTKSLKSILGSYGTEYRDIAGKLTSKIFQYMQAGDTVAKAYKKAIKEIPFGKLNAAAIEDAVYEASLKGYGITAPSVFASVEGEATLRHKLMDVAWTKDGMKLSTRLHGVDNVLRNNIKSTVQKSLQTYKTIQQTASALYEGYSDAGNVLAQAEIPEYLEKLKTLTTRLYSGDVSAAKQSPIYKAAVHDLKKLKTPGLKAAYSDVAEASTSDSKSALRKARKMTKLGASKEEINDMLVAEREKALQKALHVAAQEKTRYYAQRIARTESARAYYEGQLAADANDDDVFGYQWRLSSAHVHDKNDCDCYVYSEMDVGYGKGVFPKDDVPELPAHPNCMCHLRKIFAWEVKKTNGKDKLPEREKAPNRVDQAAEEIGAAANNDVIEAGDTKIKHIGKIDVKDTEKTIEWYEEKIVNQDIESAIIVCKDGEVYRADGSEKNVNWGLLGKEKLEGAIVTHNHPTGETRYSFSNLDVGEYFEYHLGAYRGIDEKFIYEMKTTKDTIWASKQEIEYLYKSDYYYRMLEKCAEETLDVDIDGYHKTIELIANDYSFKYTRKRR